MTLKAVYHKWECIWRRSVRSVPSAGKIAQAQSRWIFSFLLIGWKKACVFCLFHWVSIFLFIPISARIQSLLLEYKHPKPLYEVVSPQEWIRLLFCLRIIEARPTHRPISIYVLQLVETCSTNRLSSVDLQLTWLKHAFSLDYIIYQKFCIHQFSSL